MREYKFRAYWKPGKIMITSEKIESINFETKVLGVYHQIGNIGFHKLRMSDFEIMQYTGLKDKNGKDIYEGDILQGGVVIEYGETSCGCCSYVHGYDLSRNDPYYGIPEVIGNIYENTELVNT